MRTLLTPEVRARIIQTYEAAWPRLPVPAAECFGTTPGCDHAPGPRGWCSMCRERLLTLIVTTPPEGQPPYVIGGNVRFVQAEYRRYVEANPRVAGASKGGATKRANTEKKRAFLEAREAEASANAREVTAPLFAPPPVAPVTVPRSILLDATALRAHLTRLDRIEALRAELAELEAEVRAVCGG